MYSCRRGNRVKRIRPQLGDLKNGVQVGRETQGIKPERVGPGHRQDQRGAYAFSVPRTIGATAPLRI